MWLCPHSHVSHFFPLLGHTRSGFMAGALQSSSSFSTPPLCLHATPLPSHNNPRGDAEETGRAVAWPEGITHGLLFSVQPPGDRVSISLLAIRAVLAKHPQTPTSARTPSQVEDLLAWAAGRADPSPAEGGFTYMKGDHPQTKPKVA